MVAIADEFYDRKRYDASIYWFRKADKLDKKSLKCEHLSILAKMLSVCHVMSCVKRKKFVFNHFSFFRKREKFVKHKVTLRDQYQWDRMILLF